MEKSVLIVDGSLVSRMMIKEIVLSKYPDGRCIQAASIDKAIEACSDDKFDYIFLNLSAGGRSALEALPAILVQQTETKIAVLTEDPQAIIESTATMENVKPMVRPINEQDVTQFLC